MIVFHAHLDECARCRLQPMNLCERGAELLRLAATADERAKQAASHVRRFLGKEWSDAAILAIPTEPPHVK